MIFILGYEPQNIRSLHEESPTERFPKKYLFINEHQPDSVCMDIGTTLTHG